MEPIAAPSPPQAHRPAPRIALRVLRWLLLPALMALALLLAAWQSLHTAPGTRWWLELLAARLPGVTASGPAGALLGPDARLQLDRLTLSIDGTRVRIDGLRLEGLQVVGWQAHSPYVALVARELGAARVSVEWAARDPAAPPVGAPTELRLPLTLRIDRVAAARLEVAGLAAPIQDLSARLDAGTRHRVEALTLHWQGVRVQGDASIEAEAPLQLQVQLRATGDPESAPEALPPWARALNLALHARGPLAGFDTEAELSMQDQRLDARARIAPFERLPMPQLEARFARVDLARWLGPLRLSVPPPRTDLTGSALVQLGDGRPLAMELQARNAAPGRWDQQRLPLRELDLALRGSGGSWQIDKARLELAADERTDAGRVSASGRVDGLGHGGWSALSGDLQFELDRLRPDLLDRRGPPLQLSGPVTLRHAPPATMAEPAAVSSPFGTLSFEARLDGSLQGKARAQSPRPLQGAVHLEVQGQATPDGVTLDRVAARAGPAALEGRAQAHRQADGWRTEGQLNLSRFDPTLWWPGDPSADWRRATNLLNGKADWQFAVAAPLDTATLLRTMRGRIGAEFADSQLAGQPIDLQLQLRGEAGPLDATADLRAGGNRAALSALLRAPGASAGPEHLQLDLDAPALARLAPLSELFGLGPLAGQVRGEARLEGALGGWWLAGGHPHGALVTRGSLQAESLRAGALQVDAASGQWELTLPGSPQFAASSFAAAAAATGDPALRVQLELRQLRVPGLMVPAAALQADGTLAEHRASLRATLRQPPPSSVTGAAPTDGAPDPLPLVLDASLVGQWQAGSGSAPNHWRARLPAVLLQATPGALPDVLARYTTAQDPAARNGAAATPALRPLLRARDLAFDLRYDAAQMHLDAAPGTLDLLDAAVLRWRSARWDRDGSTAPRLQLEAEIEPLPVAEVLRRLQPDFGWGGDLRVGARITVRSDPEVSARVDIARSGGDLQVSEFGIVQTLGLTDARIALAVDGGVWRLTEQLAGRNLGRVSGEQTARTDATRLWPEPDAPIEGRLGATVENLGTWGAWVPAGWRLAGQLDASLRVAGRFGAPELIGEVRGRSLGVRNALEGVTLTDGELDARFEGDTARLGTLRFKSGAGSVALSGNARLGETPELQLELTAERAALIARVDRRAVGSGRAALRMDAKRVAVDGDLRIEEGLIDISRSDAPSLGDDVTVRRAGDARTSPGDEPPPARRVRREFDLNLAVQLGPRFELRGRGLDVRLGGELRLTAPSGRLAARGEIRAEQGTYVAYGQKLDIERGVISFVGPIDDPRLDIEAVRSRSDVRVGVKVGGSVRSPRIQLFSDPDLPPTEQLALLVTGRSYDSLGGSETLLLQRAALALLAGDGGAATDLDVARLLKLDELSMRQSEGAVRDTIVSVGKQISDRVYLGYERGLNATAGNWQIIYRIAQRFTLRAQSGDDPALDLVWLFRWN